MFQHILLATDLTGSSEGAIGVAAALGRAHGGRLTVLHVYEATASALADTTPAVAERTWPGGIRARRALDVVVDRLRAHGLLVEGFLRFGVVADQIFEAADGRGADLIVMGTGRRRGLARVWYGSVAERVVRGARVPVLAVPGSSARDNVVQLRTSNSPRALRPRDFET
jgi:nucleotide-binding universal stress UspA family protein